jgi:hypothetical protein
VAKSRNFCDRPELVDDDLFGGAIICGNCLDVVYLKNEERKKINY